MRGTAAGHGKARLHTDRGDGHGIRLERKVDFEASSTRDECVKGSPLEPGYRHCEVVGARGNPLDQVTTSMVGEHVPIDISKGHLCALESTAGDAVSHHTCDARWWDL